MPELDVSYSTGVACDKKGCPAEIREGEKRFADEYRDLAAARGWRRFVNRSVRWYCPEHGPGKKHDMWQTHGPKEQQ